MVKFVGPPAICVAIITLSALQRQAPGGGSVLKIIQKIWDII